MTSGALGRTNRVFPPLWIALEAPNTGRENEAAEMVEAGVAAGVPLDLTAAPGLWSGHLRGRDDLFLTAAGRSDWENATDETHATDLVQANLIQLLSSIGRERLDIYWLRVRRGVEEYQIWGALQALEAAKQEGHVGYLGLLADGPGLAVLSVWQFHDAFEVIQIPRSATRQEAYATLAPLADDRRVGVVTSRPLEWGYDLRFCDHPRVTASPEAAIRAMAQERTVLVGARSADEVRRWTTVDLSAPLDPLGEAVSTWNDPASWAPEIVGSSPSLQRAARLRAAEVGA